MNQRLIALVGLGLLVLLTITSTCYTVMQTQQAVVLQFREVLPIVSKPGLHFKIPFIQSVVYFENRVLAVDAPSQTIMLSEQKPLEVDAFARYRIADPILFYKRLRSEQVARDRLSSLFDASLRSVLGTIKTSNLLSSERVGVMEKIKEQLNSQAKDFGIEIIDVRIRRTDLPEKTSDAVFARMKSQRKQEADQLRATGQQEALQTTSEADRKAVVIIAEAQGQAEKIKGDGDRKALQIIAEAANKDPQFFAFWRSLAAYKEALKPANTTYVMSPDSEFFRYFGGANGK